MSVNGTSVSAGLDPRTLLVHFLREQVKITGTHVGAWNPGTTLAPADWKLIFKVD
jgi:carbon-monoxide dehydrogenase small subunit